MQVLSYADFSAAIHRGVVARRAPVNGAIEVTRRCNLGCAHCYNNLPMDDARARAGELTLDEHRRILDEASAEGCLWLLLTGGEVFARPDFLEIYEHARSLGMLVTIFTNGTLITPRIADRLAEMPPFSVEITLYGRTEETYEALTGVPGSHARCLRGIDLLLERDLPLKLKAVAVSINRHEIEAMKQFALERGVDFKFDAMMNPRIDCSRSPLEVRLTPEEVVALDLEDPERRDEWLRLGATCAAEPLPSPGEVYHCGGGINSFAIDPEGRMSICVLSHRDVWDLRRGSFGEGWERFLLRVRRKPATRETKCTRCGIKALCSMCPANGELESGDPEEPVEFFCRVAHLRAAALGVEVPPHGECAHCPGGEEHPSLLVSADELRRGGGTEWRSRPAFDLLPVLPASPGGKGGGCGGGGCSSCGVASARSHD